MSKLGSCRNDGAKRILNEIEMDNSSGLNKKIHKTQNYDLFTFSKLDIFGQIKEEHLKNVCIFVIGKPLRHSNYIIIILF